MTGLGLGFRSQPVQPRDAPAPGASPESHKLSVPNRFTFGHLSFDPEPCVSNQSSDWRDGPVPPDIELQGRPWPVQSAARAGLNRAFPCNSFPFSWTSALMFKHLSSAADVISNKIYVH